MARRIETPHRTYRSLSGSRFGPLYRGGRRSRQPGVLVIAGPGEPGDAQVGIVASRGVGNAVGRNRAKRRLREAMRRVSLRPGTAYVVVAAAGIEAMRFDELVAAVATGIAETEEADR
jgi:ribonuclease P protein component